MSDDYARYRVLVVEDEPLIGMDIECAVESFGHEVIGPIAELGEALNVAADESIDFAILDINIRGGNSYTVADILLKRGLPVLLLSGYGKHTLPDGLHEAAHLTKPFTVEGLDDEIRNLCARAATSGHLAAR